MCLPKQDAQETDSPSRQEKAHLGNSKGRLLEGANEGAKTDVGEIMKVRWESINGNSRLGMFLTLVIPTCTNDQLAKCA